MNKTERKEQGIQIVLGWLDDHAIELTVGCWNRSFAGTVTCIDTSDVLVRLSSFFFKFPSSPNELRQIVIGEYALDCKSNRSSGFAAKFRARCTDGVGHAQIECHLVGSEMNNEGMNEEVALSVKCDPAVLDRFANDLRCSTPQIGQVFALQTNQ